MTIPAGVVGLALALSSCRSRAQVRSPYSEGAAGLIQKLQRLTTTASAMHTGAHPDDEDSALLARLARGDHARVAYLSLNRGEGGQNVLGPEFYEALGVIRTEELLQARSLDGGEQFFTRVVDFGYTVNMPETERKWGGRDVPLADMVRVIRMYRPLVVASRFSGTAADGHGNHQLAGALTPLAVKAAADPTQFPEQLKEGLRPWQVQQAVRRHALRSEPARPADDHAADRRPGSRARTVVRADRGRGAVAAQDAGDGRRAAARPAVDGTAPRRERRAARREGAVGVRRDRHVDSRAGRARGTARRQPCRAAGDDGRCGAGGARQRRRPRARADPADTRARPEGGARGAHGRCRVGGVGRCEGRGHVPARSGDPAVRGGDAARLGRARRGAGDRRDHRARRAGERQRARLRARGDATSPSAHSRSTCHGAGRRRRSPRRHSSAAAASWRASCASSRRSRRRLR